jgi:hypothetical protein
VNTLEEAIMIANMAHSGQVDLGGEPYIYHPMRVSAAQKSPDGKVVGMLHDVVEDGIFDIAFLSTRFSVDIVNAVELLTRKPGQDYMEYIQAIADSPGKFGNTLAFNVKRADLEENMNLKRLKKVSAKDLARYEKYEKAKKILLM